MVSVQLETLNILGHRCPVLALLDRRERQAVQKRWLFARVLEQLLFKSHDRARGSLAVLLQRLSINGGCLLIDRAAVVNELVTQSEFDQVYAPRSTTSNPRCCTCQASLSPSASGRMRAFRSLLDCETASKVRKCIIVPFTVAVAGDEPALPVPRPTRAHLASRSPPCVAPHHASLCARAQRAKDSGDARRQSP